MTDDPRGTAPPVHLHHNEDEAFYILEGEVTVLVGDERIDLGAGDYCFAPRGVPHAWIVRSERARMLVTLSPAGLEQALRLPRCPGHRRRSPDRAGHPAVRRADPRVRRLRLEILGPPPSLDDLS